MTPSAPAERLCQPCTACCEGWLRISVFSRPVHPGAPCPHLGHAGCSDYANRPEHPCRSFECGWKRMPKTFPEEFRPDLSRVIILPAALNLAGRTADLAVPVGMSIPEDRLTWLKQRADFIRRPLVYLSHPTLPGEHQEDTKPNVHCHADPAFQWILRLYLAQGHRLW